MALVLNLAMQTLESGSEILESEDLWHLIEKLEVTLRRLRLRRETVKTSSPIEIEDDDGDKGLSDSLQPETVKTSSPIEIEDDDCDKDLSDYLISGQNNTIPEKIALPDSSVKDITEVITASQSNQESGIIISLSFSDAGTNQGWYNQAVGLKYEPTCANKYEPCMVERILMSLVFSFDFSS